MKTQKQLEKYSRYICGVLRHFPENIGIVLTSEGYVNIDKLVPALNANFGMAITREEILQIVATDEKGRYGLIDERMIRCNQGHSTNQVDLTFNPASPPDVLYHGTSDRNRLSILEKGIVVREDGRHYVHLSSSMDIALQVAKRHCRSGGVPHIFIVAAQKMREEGIQFYCSDNSVWLIEQVPPKFLSEI